MKLPVDAAYREERARFALKLHCEDCALWDDTRDECAHGYPTVEHRAPERRAREAGEPEQAPVVFCKDFELA